MIVACRCISPHEAVQVYIYVLSLSLSLALHHTHARILSVFRRATDDNIELITMHRSARGESLVLLCMMGPPAPFLLPLPPIYLHCLTFSVFPLYLRMDGSGVC